MRADKMATGHNADDIAETVLLNILRGDVARYSLLFAPFFLHQLHMCDVSSDYRSIHRSSLAS